MVYDVIVLTVDTRSSSTLDFKEVRKQALSLIASGKKILWHLDFGLFSDLQKPLEDKGQFSAFVLAIDHFKDKLWSEFCKFSVGIALYKGPGSFSIECNGFEEWLKDRFFSQEELEIESKGHFLNFKESGKRTTEGAFIQALWARDVGAEYLMQLGSKFKGELPLCLIFETLPEDPLLKALLTDPDRYEYLKLHSPFEWKTKEDHPKGVCMPAFSLVKPSRLGAYRKALKDFTKLIPEDKLVVSWHNLDTLYYHPESISQSGKRKIQGFIAAGGEAIPIEA